MTTWAGKCLSGIGMKIVISRAPLDVCRGGSDRILANAEDERLKNIGGEREKDMDAVRTDLKKGYIENRRRIALLFS